MEGPCMKYTRYDIKRKNNNNFIFGFVLIGTLVFAFLIGTVISNIFIKNSTIGDLPEQPKENAAEVVRVDENKKNIRYVAVQGGVFSKPENAEVVKNTLSEVGNPFTVLDTKGTRVFLGIFKEENALEAIKVLNEKTIPNSKLLFDIEVKDNCDYAITEILSAELDILSKLADKNIKSIQTEELKKWCAEELKEVDSNSKNAAVFNSLKEHINSLPMELEKNKTSEIYTYIYDTLKKMVQK
jgi:hypothetical protein